MRIVVITCLLEVIFLAGIWRIVISWAKMEMILIIIIRVGMGGICIVGIKTIWKKYKN